MREGYTHISIVLDRSSSMLACEDATREGFNKFISEQKETKGDASVTLVQFDDRYEVNYDFRDVKEVPLLNEETYQPRGSTALLDAIGKTIKDTGTRLAAMPESQRPSRVIFVIQTDGYENCSHEFTKQKVFEMIRHQQDKYKWDFLFLGANQDAIASAASMGINAKSSLSYGVHNTDKAFRAAANYTKGFREAPDMIAAAATCFSSAERDEAIAPDSGSCCATNVSSPNIIHSVPSTTTGKATVKNKK